LVHLLFRQVLGGLEHFVFGDVAVVILVEYLERQLSLGVAAVFLKQNRGQFYATHVGRSQCCDNPLWNTRHFSAKKMSFFWKVKAMVLVPVLNWL
jgi:hypothetical protein